MKDVLAKLAAGQNLAPAEMEAGVATIMDGEATPATAAAKVARTIGWPELTGDVIWLD